MSGTEPVFEARLPEIRPGPTGLILDLAIAVGFVWIAFEWVRDLTRGDWVAVGLRALFLVVIGALLWQRGKAILVRRRAAQGVGPVLRIAADGLVIPIREQHGWSGPLQVSWGAVHALEINAETQRALVVLGSRDGRHVGLPLDALSEDDRASAIAVLSAYQGSVGA